MVPPRFGKFTVLRKIASGGMAEVYLCVLRGEGGFEKKVAVKAMSPRLSGDPRFREAFALEARIAAALSHPNLVQVFDFGREGDTLFLAMEFVPGWSLAQAAAQIRLRGEPVPLPVWRHWVEGMLAGIGHLHRRGIVHRDISPSNVLVSRDGAIKVSDFGIARAGGLAGGDGGGRGGKYGYMAPEQARGEAASAATDLFAAAVVAAELFLPGRIFPGEAGRILEDLAAFEPSRILSGALPEAVRPVLEKALARDSRDRYPDADSFAAAVRGSVPRAATPRDVADFWDRLFPGTDEGTTVVVDPPLSGRGGGMVREGDPPYGGMGGRGIRWAAATTFAALAVGGVIYWHRTVPRLENVPPGPAAEGPGRASSSEGSVPPAPGGTRENRIHLVGSARDRPVPLAPARDAATRAGGERDPHSAAVRVKEGAGAETRIETEPSGVQVITGSGSALGRTPMSIDPARFRGQSLRLAKDGYAPVHVRAEDLEGLPSFRVELVRETGTIDAVHAVPWARVYDGDRYLGDTPLVGLELPTGEHRLRFRNPELGIERETRIVVGTGMNPKVVIELIPRQ